MSFRHPFARAAGTGRMIVLLCILVPLALVLLRLVVAGPRAGREPHPLVAEFRLESVDGTPVRRLKRCRAGRPMGRITLGGNGRWRIRLVHCPARWPRAGTGTYRWLADTLVLRPKRTDRRLYTGVLRGDTLDVRDSTHPHSSLFRYLRVHEPAP
jgi:hypothetical protein